MPKTPKKPREKTLKVCPLCKTDDQSWHIKKYYISLDSILFMCENLECLYPFHDEAIFDASLKRLKVPVYVDNSVTTSSSAEASSSSTSVTTTTTTMTTTTTTANANANADAAAEPAKEDNGSSEVAEPAPEESTEEDEESTEVAEPSIAKPNEAAEPTLAESAEAVIPAPPEFSPVHPLLTSTTQTSAVDSTSTTQSFLESTSQTSGQGPTSKKLKLPPNTASPPPVTMPVEITASPLLLSASSCQLDVPAVALAPKRKRSSSENADLEEDLIVDEPSHKRRSRSLERAFAVTPPPSAFDWSGASPSTSPHLTSDSSEPSSPLFNQHSLGYISDDSWTHPSTPTDSKGFSGIDMGNLYVPPSNVNETGAEDDLSKMLFADIPTDMADFQAFSSQLAFGQLDQGDDLDQLLLLQMDANNL
ncbi:hypothetical protein BGZ68_007384 [Mortierella alpina]|nr:hypothetical protein BGZ68_007384 [Mortierella alpina]